MQSTFESENLTISRIVHGKAFFNKTLLNKSYRLIADKPFYEPAIYIKNDPLAAEFSSLEVVFVYEVVTFNASERYDLDGRIFSYIWDFGDGNVTNTMFPFVDHTYTSPRNYTVTLIVVDNEGLANSTSKMIVVTIKGDFNGNRRVDIGDVTYVAYMVIGKTSSDLIADFNGNGRVDIGDLARIAYYLLGKVSEL